MYTIKQETKPLHTPLETEQTNKGIGSMQELMWFMISPVRMRLSFGKNKQNSYYCWKVIKNKSTSNENISAHLWIFECDDPIQYFWDSLNQGFLYIIFIYCKIHMWERLELSDKIIHRINWWHFIRNILVLENGPPNWCKCFSSMSPQ